MAPSVQLSVDVAHSLGGTHGEGDTRKRISQAGTIRREILRGAPLWKILRPSLWRVSPVDLDSKPRRALWDNSQECEVIDCFVSQTWLTPGWKKLLGLLMHYYSKPAAVIACAAWALVCVLDGLDWLPTVEIGTQQYGGWEGETRTSPAYLFIPLLALAVLFLSPKAPLGKRRNSLMFFDAVCINQVDEELKLEGISSLGGFLNHTKELLVLWTPEYCSRGWCVYELAMFSKLRPACKVNVSPLFKHQVVFFGLACFVFLALLFEAASWTQVSGLYGNTSVTVVATVVILYAYSVVFAATCRRYLDHVHELSAQLARFDIAEASCRDESDKAYILDSVKHWHGSLEAMNTYVRTELREQVLGSLPDHILSYGELITLCSGVLCTITPWIIGACRAGMPKHIVAAWMVSMASQLFCIVPALLKVYIIILKRLAARCSSPVCDAAKTLMLAMFNMVLFVMALTMRMKSAERYWWGALVFAGAGAVFALIVFRCPVGKKAVSPQA